MLARAEMYKEMICICTSNNRFQRTFVPAGKAKATKHLEILCYEGLAKCKNEGMISAFYVCIF